MRAAGVLVALAVALALQTTIAGLTLQGATAVNLVLVAVIFVALAFGPVTGLLAGTAGGLAQDALAGGIVGIGGLTKTLIGFLVGVIGTQFIVAQTLPRLVTFVGATLVHELCFQALYALAESRPFSIDWWSAGTQAGVNGLVGSVAFIVAERGPDLLQRRAARRASYGRRRY
ncbi:MAG TPA: rod shape-determining protein MreD [Vicinamibacterales bacterium]|nr:rod shape-determining protein MreD [Vicinamibacterales bacterium]